MVHFGGDEGTSDIQACVTAEG